MIAVVSLLALMIGLVLAVAGDAPDWLILGLLVGFVAIIGAGLF